MSASVSRRMSRKDASNAMDVCWWQWQGDMRIAAAAVRMWWRHRWGKGKGMIASGPKTSRWGIHALIGYCCDDGACTNQQCNHHGVAKKIATSIAHLGRLTRSRVPVLTSTYVGYGSILKIRLMECTMEYKRNTPVENWLFHQDGFFFMHSRSGDRYQ